MDCISQRQLLPFVFEPEQRLEMESISMAKMGQADVADWETVVAAVEVVVSKPTLD